MITKRNRAGRVQVTFVLPAGDEAVCVAGPFNEWSPTATPLKKAKDGSVRATVTVDAGARTPFRYVTSDGTWFDDDGADDHEPNEHGTTNGVVQT